MLCICNIIFEVPVLRVIIFLFVNRTFKASLIHQLCVDINRPWLRLKRDAVLLNQIAAEHRMWTECLRAHWDCHSTGGLIRHIALLQRTSLSL
jgi:hypothetical protein